MSKNGKKTIVKTTKVSKITKTLECKLTPAEWRKRATESAKLHHEREALLDRNKCAKKSMKAEEDALETRITALLKAVRTEHEERPVHCEVRPDVQSGEMYTTRLDTKEELKDSRRAMTIAERRAHYQRDLPGIHSSPPGPPAKHPEAAA